MTEQRKRLTWPDVRNKIEAYRADPDAFTESDCIAPTEACLKAASEFFRVLWYVCKPPHAFSMNRDGGVAIEWWGGNDAGATLEIGPHGEIVT